MKLECSKKSLLNAINIVSKAVSTRSTLPILNCILLTGDREGFRLLASDRELSIETDNIESDLYEKGSVAIDAKMFADIIKALPTEMVTLTVDEKMFAILNPVSLNLLLMVSQLNSSQKFRL